MNTWQLWRREQIPSATYRLECRCGVPVWSDGSGRHNHRTQHGHAPTTDDEYAAIRARVEALLAARKGAGA